ncbi:MAG: glyoxylate/hydroxypyruvate/2-ketogluconate reductase [Betaproteobacteria bacterium]|jgi:gluconate 2-dehydrogenase|nr:glyoxylate/hydroxypyruvate/2-ketogluconate reductase [Betaproteobacteria bacterium]
MRPKILVTREVFDETLEYLREHCDVDANQEDMALAPDALMKRLADKEGVICSLTDRIDAALLERCPKLKVVANIAVGYNNIDVPACSARGIMATNTPGVLDDSTADLAWTLMLGAARRITEVERYVRNGEWKGWRLKQWLGIDVHHATLGIIGMGRIGQAIARRAAGFDMRVLYHNRKRVDEEIERKLNTRWVSLDELLGKSDFVVLQVPYSPETHHLIGAAQLSKMKRNAILINSTRGGVVDDQALISALRNGTIRAAGLDVFENEPKLNPAFLDLDNVVLAPHIGSSTEATRRAMAMTAAKNAVAVLIGSTPPNLINAEAIRS